MSNSDVKSKILQYQILQYISSLKEAEPDNAENYDVAMQCLSNSFGVNLADVNDFQQYAYYPATLPDIVEAGAQQLGLNSYRNTVETMNKNPKFATFVDTVAKRGYFDGTDAGSLDYLKRHAKVMAKFSAKIEKKESAPQPAATPVAPAQSPEELQAQADEKKNAGNAALAKKDYTGAIDLYTQALRLSSAGSNSHIYYCNRAAALCHVNKYADAIQDCNAALKLNPQYVKAYSRLGLCYFFLEQYEKAIDTYNKALELEPSNQSIKDAITQAKNKQKAKATPPMDMSSMANMFGGNDGMASLFQNPALMSMAQQMMSNPEMMKQAMSMMGGMGNGGGMPDMSALAGMMGGAQQGGAAGGIPSFSGFDGDAAPATPPGAPAGAADMMSRLQNSPEFREMQNDPAMAVFAAKMRSGDTAGAMAEAQKNPALMQKMMSLMSNLK